MLERDMPVPDLWPREREPRRGFRFALSPDGRAWVALFPFGGPADEASRIANDMLRLIVDEAEVRGFFERRVRIISEEMSKKPDHMSAEVFIRTEQYAPEALSECIRESLDRLSAGVLNTAECQTAQIRVVIRAGKAVQQAWKRRNLLAIKEAFAALGQVNEHIDEAHAPIIRQYQAFLDTLEGQPSESFEVTQQIVGMIRDTASRLEMAIACPKENCGLPARIRFVKSGRSVHGFFQFDHIVDGRRTTHGGMPTFPRLVLVPFAGSQEDPEDS